MGWWWVNWCAVELVARAGGGICSLVVVRGSWPAACGVASRGAWSACVRGAGAPTEREPEAKMVVDGDG